MPKKIDKKEKNEKRIQICSVCGSPDIETDFSNHAAVVSGYMSVKKCNNCGFKGTFFPTIPLSQLRKPKAREEVEIKDELYNKNFINGIIGFWKILGIVMIALGTCALFIPRLFILGISFSLPLGILVTSYGFLYNRNKERLFMKLLMIFIVLFFILGGLVSLAYIGM